MPVPDTLQQLCVAAFVATIPEYKGRLALRCLADSVPEDVFVLLEDAAAERKRHWTNKMAFGRKRW